MTQNRTETARDESAPADASQNYFDPTQLWAAGFEAWTRLARDNAEHIQSLYQDRSWSTPEGRLDPLSIWSASVDAWNHFARENLERAESMRSELESLERITHEQAKKSTKALTSIVNESVDCAFDIGREWRRIGLDTIRRSANIFGA